MSNQQSPTQTQSNQPKPKALNPQQTTRSQSKSKSTAPPQLLLNTPIPTPSMTSIRPVNLSSKTGNDFHGLDAVFRATAGPAYKVEPTATIGSYLYCHQYPALVPRTCFVLEDSTGQVVGYILAAASTSDFCDAWKRHTPNLLRALGRQDVGAPPSAVDLRTPLPAFEDDPAGHLLHMACKQPEEMLNANMPDLWEKWPAHFHVNILPEYQRKGGGKRLIDQMLRALWVESCKGVHLGMEAGNEGAEKFYTAMGFTRYPGVLDDGVSGEVGRTGGANATIYLVMSLDEKEEEMEG